MTNIRKSFIALLCLYYVMVLCNARPARPRFPFMPFLRLNGRSRRLEMRLRLGVDKGVGLSQMSGIRHHDFGQLRNRGISRTSLPLRPQLNGNLGNNDPPRKLNPSEEYSPAEYTAPDPYYSENRESAPAGIVQMSEQDKLAIFTAFVVKYNYTSISIADQSDLVREVQKNYGLPETGNLDEVTVTAMLKPRCGVPDGPAEYNTFANRQKWTGKTVTYQILGYSPDMSQCQIRNAFRRAFRVWEEVIELTFVEASEDPDIIIYFGYEEHGDGYPFDGPNGLLAHAFTPGTDDISGDTHFDEGEFWTLGNGKVFDTYNGNSPGEPCVFPFYFQERSYTTCTSDGRHDELEWCATTDDYDRDQKFAFCPHEKLFTYGGNADNDPCVFPFTFLDKTFDSCTYEGRSDGYEWCATTANFDTDSRWGFCPKRAHGTSGGNAGGASCKFPFTFQRATYSSCTTEGRSDLLLWCSTTSNYDDDGKWGFCDGDGYSLFLVAAHEFGHAIGLDHSNVHSALMYPVYEYRHNFVLPDDDKRGIRDLYGGSRRSYLPPLKLEKCGGSLGETETATTTTSPGRITTTTARPQTTPSNGRCPRHPMPKEICDIKIDSMVLWGNQAYIFEGEYYWIMDRRDNGKGKGKLRARDAYPISGKWAEVRCNADAVYLLGERSDRIVFFKKSQYYVYDSQGIERGYPREVTELGLPAKTKVDAVARMSLRNTSILLYYFAQNNVYRADPNTGMVVGAKVTQLATHEAWSGLPKTLDAAFTDSKNEFFTYFLKDNKLYRYQNSQGRQVSTIKATNYFGCKSKLKKVALPLKGRKERN